jgi:hypothetical protein
MNNQQPDFMQFMNNKLNSIYFGAGDNIEIIETLPCETGIKLLSVMLSYACQAQNTAIILHARSSIRMLSIDWLIYNLPIASNEGIDFHDEWDYRRLLELISEAVPQLLSWAIDKGINSPNEEVRETAEEFMKRLPS